MAKQPKPPPEDLLAKIADLYHNRHCTYGQIAKATGQDPHKIRELLEEARALLTIVIRRPTLESELISKFTHLVDVRVVQETLETDSYGRLLKIWGQVAADYFETLVDTGEPLMVGLSGGDTIFHFIDNLPLRTRPNVDALPLALVGRGCSGVSEAHIDPSVNATFFWIKCGRQGGRLRYATVPLYHQDGREQMNDLATKDEAVHAALDSMKFINVAFAGLGNITALDNSRKPEDLPKISPFTSQHLIPNKRRQQLVEEGVIGEISYCPFGEDGGGSTEWQLFLTPGHGTKYSGVSFYEKVVVDAQREPVYKKKKKVIAIAGAQKERIIRAALVGKLFNVWITDAATAKTMLQIKV